MTVDDKTVSISVGKVEFPDGLVTPEKRRDVRESAIHPSPTVAERKPTSNSKSDSNDSGVVLLALPQAACAWHQSCWHGRNAVDGH